MSSGKPPARRGAVRVNGLAVLLSIVVVGLVTGAGFYRYRRSAMDERLARELSDAPETPEERLDLWLQLAGPQIHHRLAVVGRFSEAMPWLVTHAVARADGASELWGLDCAELTPALAHRKGLVVVVELPAPRPLGRSDLAKGQENRVPVYPAGAELDPAARVNELVLYLLGGMPRALARDIPGARIEVRVAPR